MNATTALHQAIATGLKIAEVLQINASNGRRMTRFVLTDAASVFDSNRQDTLDLFFDGNGCYTTTDSDEYPVTLSDIYAGLSRWNA